MGISSKNAFSKSEKLCSKKKIDSLFLSGQSFISYPLRVVYKMEETDSDGRSVRVLINVSKRKFKRAVKRNRVKRLIREAYRLNKSSFGGIFVPQNRSLEVAFLYLKNELPTYPEIEKSMIKAAILLSEKLAKGNDK